MTKLASMTERMAAAAERMETAYSQQTQAITQLANALGQLNLGDSVASINNLNKSLKDAQTRMNDTGKAGDANFKKLGKAVLGAGDNLGKKFPKSATIATAALTGLYQGIQNVVAMGKGIGGFFTSFVSGLGNITASILAIPIKIFTGLIDMAAKSAGGSNELMQALEDLRKQFGAFYGPTNKAIITTTKSMSGFQATGLSTWRVFGNMAQRLEYMNKLVTEMGASFGKLQNEFQQNGGALLAYQKGLGLGGEEMKNVTLQAASMGTKASKTLNEMTKLSYELGDAFELDAKQISRDMGKALGDVAHFGGATVKQIAEASTYARKLGVELDKITGSLDAFDTYDQAAENAAKLSQAMGVQIDAFEMMQAQSPAEQMEMLRKSFARAGVDASTFNRAQLKLVASTTGYDEQTVKTALSLKNQGASMDQIKKKGTEAEKKTLTQEEAMSKLADAIERLTFSGSAMHGGFWDMFVAGIKNGLMSSKEFVTIMYEIRQALMQVFREGVKLGKQLIDLVPGFKDIAKGLVDVFNPAKITGLFKGIRQAVEKFFGKGDNPENPEKGSIPAFIANLKNTFTAFFDKESPAAKRMLQGFKTFFTFLRDLAIQGIKVVSESLADGMRSIVDMISGKKKVPGAGAVGEAGKGALGFLSDMFGPIIDALKKAWVTMAPALEELASTLWKKFKDFLWKHKSIVIKGLGAIAAMMFGPAVTRSLLGMGVNAIGGGIKDMLGGAIKMAMGGAEDVAAKAAGSSGGLLTKIMGPLLGNPYVAAAAAVAALGVVGVGFSKGVQKFKDGIAKDIGDDTDKKVGASVAGIVQLLSFGAVSDEAAQGMASNFAKYADDINKVVENLFGKDFAKDLKAMISTEFDELIDIGDFFRHLFAGDIGGAVKSLGKFLYDVGVGAINQLKMVFLTIPEKLLTWLSDGIQALSDWLDKLFQPGTDSSMIDSIVDGFKKVGEFILPLVSDIPGRLLTLFGNKIGPALLHLTGTILGLIARIPGAIFELLSDGFKYLFGKDNVVSKYVLDPIVKGLYELGNAIPFFFKYIGNALSSGIDFLKAKMSGGDTSQIKVFPNIGDEYTKYKASLKSTTAAVVEDNKSAQAQIADAAKAPGGPAAEKTDTTGFIHKATETLDDLKKVKASLKDVSAKDLAVIKMAFQKVFTMFGDEKELQENATKSESISKAFGALSNIAQSAVNVSSLVQSDKIKNLGPSLQFLKQASAAVKVMITDKDMMVPPESIANIASVGKAFESIQQLGEAYKDMSDTMVKAVGNVKAGGIAPALMAVQQMIKISNDLNSALADGNLNKIDIKAKLQNVANAVGLGGKATYTVNPSKAVQITVNMQVTMDVGEVEKVMVLRKSSIIADRLDFATINNVGQTINAPALGTLNPASPPDVPAPAKP